MKHIASLAAIVAAICLIVSPAGAQKLGALPAATTVNATDKIPVSQSGVTAAITPAQIAVYLASSFQPIDPDLTSIAALATTPFGRNLLTTADAATTRSILGLGTLATQSGAFSGTSSGTNTGDQTSVTGNAGTATKLVTARTIAGNSFDGSANIVIADTDLNGAAWTTYTPSLSCGTGSLTSATAAGRYKRIGKTVFVQITVAVTTNGTCASYVISSVPFAAAAATSSTYWTLPGRERAVSGKMLQGEVFNGSTTVVIFNYDNSFVGANGALINLTGIYEAD